MFRFLIVILLMICSCGKEEQAAKVVRTVSYPTPYVTVTNYPLYWLVKEMDPWRNISFPAPHDIDPAYWTPDDQDIAKMQKSELILLNGATYEKWLKGVSLPAGKTIDTSGDSADKFILLKDQVEHAHNGSTHRHSGTDFNTWLDFDIFMEQAVSVESLLRQLDRQGPDFSSGLKRIEGKIKALKMLIQNINTPDKKNQFLASHPVYNYLARANGWKVQNFHWEPEEMPSEEEWEKLKKAVSFSKYMLWEDTPSKEIAERLRNEGVSIIVFRPCGNRPPSGDFFSEMIQNIENLKTALEAK